MKEANPIALVDELKTVLQRYITTTLPISRRYPALAGRFREELGAQKLVEGPYVEALPDYEKGRSLDELLLRNGGFLHDAMGELPTAGRKLHMHQETALTLAAKDGKSLLVATGTGSGKTETFLYPIAHSLLSDPEPEKPGVRALLIYPMNALANDQLYYRIAPLFGRHLRDHGVTFGRYTGQVKANAKRSEEESGLFNNAKLMQALGEPDEIPSNWLLTREEMLHNPPKVLVTNYAMLEHLLLLPRNERLFSSNALRTIVLDEIHTYHGAQATEVAFLLRKLKNRLGLDSPLQVFGTSASLADGDDADEKLKAFSSGLFGEEVQTVVRGKRVLHERLRGTSSNEFSLSAAHWVALGEVIEAFVKTAEEDRVPDVWNDLLEHSGVARQELYAAPEASIASFLESAFSCNTEVRRVAKYLDRGGVKSFRELAPLVFDSLVEVVEEEARYQALSAVIRMGMLARADESGFPLLPGRYHLAVNSIEGLAVLPSAENEGWSKLKAARHYRDDDGFYFPLLTCRKCGQPYLEGYEEGGRLHNRRPDDRESRGQRRVFWLGKPVGYVEDEVDEVDETNAAEYQKFWLDVKTGELSATSDAVALYAIQTEKDEQEKLWYVRKCPACGGIASGTDAEVVTRMHPGNEALGSVVTQRILEALPPAIVDHSEPRPALGRTLLAFSDNRQDAAFFAPYFERTSADIALRSAIRNVLRERSSPLSAPQLADQVYQHWQRGGQLPVVLDVNGDMLTDRQDALPALLGALAFEFCTPGGRRNSVEALGIVSVTYETQKLSALVQKVKSFWPTQLPSDDASVRSLIHILLENIRRERALSRFHNVPLKDEHIWGTYNQHRTFDVEGGDDQVSYKWLPSQEHSRNNRRTWYLIEQLGLSREDAFRFLRQFWEVLLRPPVAILQRYQPGFGLDGETIRFQNGDSQPLYVCKSCGLKQQYVVGSKCVAFRCRGDAEALTSEERDLLRKQNHYIASYDEAQHTTVRAREHTASLSTELRENIERDFSARKLNLLSCTTTMEMGVDLGDLEAVVNLNVPPGIANYQQRTGRAGRRAQAAPFCVTVARNTNFDQAVVRQFPDYLASSPEAPFIHLENRELFKRHQYSVLLSHFLRYRISDKEANAPSLKHLFGESFNEEALREFTDTLLQWFESERGLAAMREAEALVGRLPEQAKRAGATGSSLRNEFIAAVREFAHEVCERFAKYTEKMAEAGGGEDFGKARYWQRLREEFMGQFLVTQLSQRGLIPTYSFPVHSLSLDVVSESGQNYGQKSDVALSRDASLGISEYAPGAEVVANGRIWESAGLAQYPKAFMPERWYAACAECFHVDVGDAPDEIAASCSNCGASEGRRKRKFVEPHGFVTSYGQRRGRDPGSSRRRVKPADEARLIAAPRDEVFQETEVPFLTSALLTANSNDEGGLRGSLFIANRGAYGEGYHRCNLCNFAAPVKAASATSRTPAKKKGADAAAPKFVHDDPMTGQKCPNERASKMGLDFVHRFDTDVRLLRFVEPMPFPETTEMAPRRFHERLARTVAEAMRMAARELLGVYPGEVRAIYRLYGTAGTKFEVILYDAVPGGAGYCARIGQPGFSFQDLLSKTSQQLDCPAQCESGCRVCLCDYSNQRYWDGFERKAALDWLRSLLQESDESDNAGSYVRWNAPSLAGLAERFANFPGISLVARTLVDASSFSEESLNQVVSWMQNGKTVKMYFANELSGRPTSHAPLTVYRRLYPYVQEGKLHLFKMTDAFASQWDSLPRVFVDISRGSPTVRQRFPGHTLMDALIAAPAEIGVVDEAADNILRDLESSSVAYGSELLRDGEKMKMWELRKGDLRPFSDIFAVAKGAHIKELAVRDPYCGARPNEQALSAFLRLIQSYATAIDYVSVHCKEVRDRDGEVEFYLDVERRVDGLISGLGLEQRDVTVLRLKGNNRAFHDREVDIVTVTADGCDEKHRFFLTGGVEYLMNKEAETRIFYSRID